jgi:hypothetical protein
MSVTLAADTAQIAPTASDALTNLVVPIMFSAAVNASQQVVVYADTLGDSITANKLVNLHVPIAKLNNVFKYSIREGNSSNPAASTLGAYNLALDFTTLGYDASSVAKWNNSFDYVAGQTPGTALVANSTAYDSVNSNFTPPFSQWRSWLMSSTAFSSLVGNDALMSSETHSFSQTGLFKTSAGDAADVGLLQNASDNQLLPFYRTAAVYGKITADISAGENIGMGSSTTSGEYRFGLTLSKGDTLVAFVKFAQDFDLKFKLNTNPESLIDPSFNDGNIYDSNDSAKGLKMIINKALVSLTDVSKSETVIYKFVFTASG